MAQNISVPDIGDFKDVEVIEVLVKPGDQINKNDPIVTIESDKSSVEIPSPAAGEIKDLKVKIGDKVSEGSVLATIENGQAASAPKEKKIVKEVQTQEKTKTNGEANQLRQVKKVFAEPASKDDIDPIETNEWIDSLNSVIENDGYSRASYLLNKVIDQAYKSGLVLPDTRTTPYINTIPPEAEIKSLGDQNIEKKIRAYVRWNAAAIDWVVDVTAGAIGIFAHNVVGNTSFVIEVIFVNSMMLSSASIPWVKSTLVWWMWFMAERAFCDAVLFVEFGIDAEPYAWVGFHWKKWNGVVRVK